MKRLLIAALLALGACTSPAPSEIIVWATVERSQDLGTAEEAPAYYEHPLAPDAGAEIVLRLDDGNKVTVVNGAERRFEPGQRVRVVVGSHGAFLL